MKFRSIVAFVLLLVFALAVAPTAEAAKISFKLGHSVSDQHPYHLGAEKFKEIVEKESGGEIEIALFPNNQLGTGERDLLEGLQLGTVDIYVGSTGPMGGFEKKFMLFDFPFLFKDKAQAYSVLDGEIGQYVMGLLDKIGIKGLAWYENGFRHFTNSKRPVNTPEDAKGLKLRTMENKIHMALWKVMGADPTPMAWGEVFTALQQGTVDGQENPIPIIFVQKIYEVQKHLALTGHVFSPAMIAIAEAKFNGLSEEHKALFLKAAKESALYQREQITRMEDEQVAKLKELGMQVTEPDVALFREATKPVYDEFKGELGEDAKLLDQILSGN
ncbi:MAG: DctP family TRAP transporter solute-binding subunit [Synergistaceae bacterium]|nr:DctP family TRAP transporter solute-binding subunit [Synergistaceae bacterium]